MSLENHMVVGPDDFDNVCTHENISVDDVFVRAWDGYNSLSTYKYPALSKDSHITDMFELFVIVSCHNCDKTQEQVLDLDHFIYETRYRWIE